MNYAETISTIANSIASTFDEVYFDAEIIVNDKGIKKPAIALNDEWISLAPTDQRETIYIRRNGDDEVLEELKLGSCIKSYKMRSSLRIVFFKHVANNHSEIIFRMMQSVLITGTRLKAILRDKWKLKKDESSGDYNFKASTAYFAIDIYALWNLIPDSCEQAFCVDIINPLKRESCPAVVQES